MEKSCATLGGTRRTPFIYTTNWQVAAIVDCLSNFSSLITISVDNMLRILVLAVTFTNRVVDHDSSFFILVSGFFYMKFLLTD